MAFGHGGNVRSLAIRAGCEIGELLDFSANINPLGPPEGLRRVIASHLNRVVHYPDPCCMALREAIASELPVSTDQGVCGNGSTEILYALPRALSVSRAVIPVPSYIDYAVSARKAGLEVQTVVLNPETGFVIDWKRVERELSGNEMVITGQPANPSGAMFDPAGLAELADRHPSTWFVVDEAFADFVEGYRSTISLERPNIVVMRSMTKFYAIPGLRLGHALAPEPVAARIAGCLPPWSVGSLAQAAGVACLLDHAYADRTRKETVRLREQLRQGLMDAAPVEVFPSPANYLLARLTSTRYTAAELAEQMLARRIAIRVCDNYEGLTDRYFRVAVRTETENERLLETFREIFVSDVPSRPQWYRQHPRTPAIMFQGTSSNAGKSVLTAAFCRILLQDGFRVAPFKAQNMSLNSFVTRNGGEMGRAQVVQAQACRMDPDVRMNPVLLKPNSDTGAQVIVMGKPVGNMDVDAYIRYKPTAFEMVRQAYASLASTVDAVVIEGAGSPAEVNLKHHDIVNMAMAAHARAPVLLVGDIDRGGVFASFVGTMEVLSETERSRIAGFVINRFRGNRNLLADAIRFLEEHSGLPTWGVIPYIPDAGIPEEDSVSFKMPRKDTAEPGPDQVEMIVIDLPHISNFTDFDPLRLEPDVCLRVVNRLDQLTVADRLPDAVILPGSKNVPGDLRHLRESGMAEAIDRLARQGVSLIGICGGLQMLGRTIEDPHRLESDGTPRQGLGLLAVDTVLEAGKTLKLVSARHLESGCVLQGYEIHHGATHGTDAVPAMVREDGAVIGFVSENGRIFGSYLHGLFDDDRFRRWTIDRLRAQKGLSTDGSIRVTYDIHGALDRLADIVRANLDVNAIYRKMGLR